MKEKLMTVDELHKEIGNLPPDLEIHLYLEEDGLVSDWALDGAIFRVEETSNLDIAVIDLVGD